MGFKLQLYNQITMSDDESLRVPNFYKNMQERKARKKKEQMYHINRNCEKKSSDIDGKTRRKWTP